MSDLKESARLQFAGYVQSTAFNLSLSRYMVERLAVIWESSGVEGTNGNGGVICDGSSVDDLIRRGLVYIDPAAAPDFLRRGRIGGGQHVIYANKRPLRLTKAGQLTCLLLQEAGLISKRRARASRKEAA